MPDIETLDLSVKSYAVIKRMGINTTEELKDRIEDVLLHTQKAGEEAIEKLNALSIVPSEQHKQAIELHQKILVSASLAQQNLWDMCNGLKQMRDGKLYKELGYQNFEAYCENEVGIKRSCAYKYISIIENVHLENVHTYGQIGTSKLALLATISESEQQIISEKVNLEETTVKQLKAEIDKLKSEKKNYEELIEDINADKHEAEAQAEQAEYNLKDVEKELEISERKLKEAKGENNRLEKQLSQQQENYSIHTKRRDERISELEKQVKELESRPIDVAVVDRPIENDPKFKEIVRSLERENMKRNEELEQQYREDEKAVRKMLEKDKQKALSELREEYEKKLAEQSKAEPVDEDKIKFKVYLSSAYGILGDLLVLASHHTEPFYKKEIKELLINTLTNMEE